MELQTDLSKFYKPITETQKATAREITEGLKPIREGIEKLPQAMQPLGEATGEAPEEEKEEEEEEELIGKIAYEFLNKPYRDTTFGIRKEKGRHYIGDTPVIIHRDNIIVDGEKFKGTPGLWELITSNKPQNYTEEDYDNYEDLMIMTDALHRNNDSSNPYPKASGSDKWKYILSRIWYKKKSRIIFPKKKEGDEGEGVVVIPSDPNALLERLDILLGSQKAGHTNVGNELVSICDE